METDNHGMFGWIISIKKYQISIIAPMLRSGDKRENCSPRISSNLLCQYDNMIALVSGNKQQSERPPTKIIRTGMIPLSLSMKVLNYRSVHA